MKKFGFFASLFVAIAVVASAVNSQFSFQPVKANMPKEVKAMLKGVNNLANRVQGNAPAKVNFSGTELQTPPGGLDTEVYTVSGWTEIADWDSYSPLVAIDGNTMWVKNIVWYATDVWVKGTIEGDKVTFAQGQYLGAGTGAFNKQHDHTYLCAWDGSNNIVDLTLDWDADAKKLYLNHFKYGGSCSATGEAVEQVDGDDEWSNKGWTLKGTGTAGPKTEGGSTGGDEDQSNEELVTSFDLTQEVNFTPFTVIDGNGDGKTWAWTPGSTCAWFNNMGTSKTADEWLITPNIELKAGKTYKMVINACSQDVKWPETVELAYGAGVTAAAMSNVILEPTVLKFTTKTDVESDLFTIKETGNYNLGVHCVSPADMYFLKLYTISLYEVKVGSIPAPAQNLKATPNAVGELNAVVEFDMPASYANGDAIPDGTTLDYLVTRNTNDTIQTGTAAVGAHVNFTDEVEANGSYTYTVIVKKGALESDPVSYTTSIGVDIPGKPSNLKHEFLYPGMRFTWDRVSNVGQGGGYVDPSKCIYKLYTLTVQGGSLYRDVLLSDPTIYDSTSHTFRWTDFEVDEQYRQYYSVFASNEAGDGYAEINSFFAGAKYTLPFTEGFAEGKAHYFWDGSQPDESLALGAGHMELAQGISTDGDNYCAVIKSDIDENFVSMNSGKISLDGAVSPVLSFEARYLPNASGVAPKADGANGIVVYAYKADGSHEILVQKILSTSFETFTIDLKSYRKTDYMYLEFYCVFGNAGQVQLDNISVYDNVEDAVAAEVDVPSTIYAGDMAPITVTVTNEGSNPITNYNLTIKVDGEELVADNIVETVNFHRKSTTVNYLTTSLFDEIGTKAITVDVMTNGGATAHCDAELTVLAPVVSKPLALEAEFASENTVSANWTAPEKPMAPEVETFEDYPAWSTQFGEWKCINADNTYSQQVLDVKSPVDGTQYAWAIFNWNQLLNTTGFEGHSGEQFIGNTWCASSASGSAYAEEVEDWIVSPELPGIAQTIGFWLNDNGLEWPTHWQGLYSTDGNNMSDFRECTQKTTGGYAEWSYKSFDVPEGAKYFAIRRTQTENSPGVFVLLDDISYVGVKGEIAGYNVYVDGEFYAFVTTTSALLEGVTPEGHDISVTTVYTDESESLPVTVYVEYSLTGVKDIIAKGVKTIKKIENGQVIIVRGDQQFNIMGQPIK